MAFTYIYFLAFMLLNISILIPCSFGYVSGNEYGTKKQVVTKRPNFTEKLFSNNIGIQGIVYCKSGSKLIQLEGKLHSFYLIITSVTFKIFFHSKIIRLDSSLNFDTHSCVFGFLVIIIVLFMDL